MEAANTVAKAVVELALKAALAEIDRLRIVCQEAYTEGFNDAGAYKWTDGNMRHLWENSNAAFDMMNPAAKGSDPMSIYTVVRALAVPEMAPAGYACHGRKTRQEALSEARAHYVRVRDEAEWMLAEIESDEAVVTVEAGVHQPRLLATLEPSP